MQSLCFHKLGVFILGFCPNSWEEFNEKHESNVPKSSGTKEDWKLGGPTLLQCNRVLYSFCFAIFVQILCMYVCFFTSLCL